MNSRIHYLAVVGAVALVVGACSTTGQQPATSPPTTNPSTESTEPASAGEESSIVWEPCGSLECATIEVPLDYDDPDGETIELALNRRPAADPTERIGALFVNPGGPGGSAKELVPVLGLPSDVRDRFDIVGMDPRGVGDSTPLECNTHLLDMYDADPTMEDQADIDAFVAVSQAFVDECEAEHADVLAHLGTENVARDMDMVREAMGDDQLSYLGFSYGTSIGQQYARLFPDRVRAMILDGVVDIGPSGPEAAATQAEGFNLALDAFIEYCDSGRCGFTAPAQQVIDTVVASAEASPIPAPGADRDATPGVVNLALAQGLYSDTLWTSLAQALIRAQGGDGTGLVRLADFYLGHGGDGSFDSSFEIYFAVSCLDWDWPDDPNVMLAEAAELGDQYPVLGEGLMTDYLRCAMWPVEPQPLEAVPSDLDGLPTILVVSTTGDPATPYESGVTLAETLPDGRLVTYEGEGHTIVGQGEQCIDQIAGDYLIDLEAPDDDVTC